MSLIPSLQEASQVLAQFPGASGCAKIIPQGNRGGFSGAGLWRVESDECNLCLRAWPAEGMTTERLTEIHHLMAKARDTGLAFVPAVMKDRRGGSWVASGGRLWELTTWMNGQADFHAHPSFGRARAAFVALARLHLVWALTSGSSGPCPGVQRRLEAAREWRTLVLSGWRPSFIPDNTDPVQPWAERAWQRLQKAADRIIDQLGPWASRSFTLHPCLCDVWHDHILFEGDRVTGIVDYGGVKWDHVSVDLARLLGSMLGDDAELRTAALRAYSGLRPLSLEEEALIAVLDETGTRIGAMNWLKWLYLEESNYEDRGAVARKLAELVKRIENEAS
jgi:homoserine kinase type II